MTLELHSRSETSHIFDKIKQKVCASVSKEAPQQLCRQRIFKIKTSNDLQCEIEFHAQANSQTKRKI